MDLVTVKTFRVIDGRQVTAWVDREFGPLVGILLLGTFFGAWLLPEFFQPESNQAAMGGLSFFPWFILTEIGWSLIMTWVYNNTKQSSLIAGYLFHTAFNTWSLVLLTNAVPGEALPAFDRTLFIITAVVIALAGATAAIATKGKLGYTALPAEPQQ